MSVIENRKALEQRDSFGIGAPNTAFAQYFIGNACLKPLTEFSLCPVFMANVAFEPGCRSNGHIHHADKGGGQLLICTAGEGWYQEEGKEAVSLVPVRSSRSRPMSSIGTARKRTAGSHTLP